MNDVAAPDVFGPATLGPVQLRNRTVKAATFEGRTPHGLVTDELIDYHLAPARGCLPRSRARGTYVQRGHRRQRPVGARAGSAH
jgi:2,4-dienoyl-CoA reductase-like NADH-dependent reductase (Old Yellow Enzyme family)